MSKVTQEDVLKAKKVLAELRADKESKKEDVLAAKNEVNRLKAEYAKLTESKEA